MLFDELNHESFLFRTGATHDHRCRLLRDRAEQLFHCIASNDAVQHVSVDNQRAAKLCALDCIVPRWLLL